MLAGNDLFNRNTRIALTALLYNSHAPRDLVQFIVCTDQAKDRHVSKARVQAF